MERRFVKSARQALQLYDKLILGLLLGLLAVALVLEGIKLRQTRAAVGEAQAPVEFSRELVPETEPAAPAIAIAPEEQWQLAPSLELGTFDRRALQSVISPDRLAILPERDGTLIDPPLYAYSLNDPHMLLHYGTRYHPLTGQREQPAVVDNPPEQALQALATYLYYRGTEEEVLPFVLANISMDNPMDRASWHFQFNVQTPQGRRSHFVKLGQAIPGTDNMLLTDAVVSYVKDSHDIQRLHAVATITHGEQSFRVPLKTIVPSGEQQHTLVMLPPDGSAPVTVTVKVGEPFLLSVVAGTVRQERYQLVSAEPMQVVNLEAPEGASYHLRTFTVPPLTEAVLEAFEARGLSWRQPAEAPTHFGPSLP